MELFILYLKGLGTLIGTGIWIVIFNVIWNKFNPNDKLEGPSSLVTPLLIPFAIIMLLLMPLIIGIEFYKL